MQLLQQGGPPSCSQDNTSSQTADLDLMARCRQDSPYRPINWRWQRACLLAKNYTESRNAAEELIVRRAVHFLRWRDRCKRHDQLEELIQTYPAIAAAHELFRGLHGPDRPDPLRNEIEARILARQAPEEIDACVPLVPGTTACYEQLFFNVLDRIDKRSFILHQVIGGESSIHDALEPEDYAVLWKLYGYVRGVQMLEFVIYTVSDWNRPRGSEQVMESFKEDFRHTLRRKAALAARSIAVTSRTCGRLIELYAQITRIEALTGDSEQPSMHANIEAMFAHLQLMVGTPSVGAGIEGHNTMVAGLRAGELLAAAAGKPPDMDKLRALKFPEKPEDDLLQEPFGSAVHAPGTGAPQPHSTRQAPPPPGPGTFGRQDQGTVEEELVGMPKEDSPPVKLLVPEEAAIG